MTVREAFERFGSGIVVETLRRGCGFGNGPTMVPTGNVYKLAAASPDGKVVAWKQYRQGKVGLFADNPCRVLDSRPYHGTYGPF